MFLFLFILRTTTMLAVVSYSLLILIFSSFANGDNEHNDNCGVLVKSSCCDNLTTKWNKKNVGQELKIWLKEIHILTPVQERDKHNFNLRKKVLHEKGSKYIRYIGNINCSNKNMVGPIWQIAGTINGISYMNQFYNGFLYGIEDKTGSMTGFSLIIFYYIRVLQSMYVRLKLVLKITFHFCD